MKKILAVALLATCSSAFADVTLYGKVAIGIENDKFPGNVTPAGNSVQSYGSYFGIRGSDPVYGMTSVIWMVEQYIDPTAGQAYANTSGGGLVVPNPSGTSTSGRPTTSVNTLASSETYLGLQSIWGSVKFGNLSNYVRSNQGAVDTFNSGNGANGMVSSRSAALLPFSARYDSPVWNGFSFAGVYSFNNAGASNISSVSATSALTNDVNGYYNGGIYSLGLSWKNGDMLVTASTQIWQNVGSYSNSTNGYAYNSYTANYPNAIYNNAYMNRLELSYGGDHDGVMGAVAFQTSSGYGWNSVANSGGSWGNVGFGAVGSALPAGMTTNQYQTQELSASLGYRVGVFVPKIGYSYGGNLMYNGNVWDVAVGSASSIADTGYQQGIAELDWNITPRTIVFVNYGQIWWGSTAQSMNFGAPSATPCTNNNCGSATGGTGYVQSQATTAVGLSHTF